MSTLQPSSRAEELMIEILARRRTPMTLGEIVDAMLRQEPSVLSGATPQKSMYSIIFRREKRREAGEMPLLFKKTKERGSILYQLNK